MKKQTIIAGILISICSCTKPDSSSTSGTTTTSASTLSIAFNGKTYNLTTSPTSVATVLNATTSSATSASSGLTSWGVLITGLSTEVQLNFSGTKLNNPNSAVGTYKSGIGNSTVFGALELTDRNDGNKRYTSDFSGADTTSTITVTTSTATECKGSYSVVLTYNGQYYPATGQFNIHR